MIDYDNRATLKVPKEVALKLDKKARDMGIQTRAHCATYANMILARDVQDKPKDAYVESEV
jgi:hypothetical protein